MAATVNHQQKPAARRRACFDFMTVLPLCFDRYDNNDDDGCYFY